MPLVNLLLKESFSARNSTTKAKEIKIAMRELGVDVRYGKANRARLKAQDLEVVVQEQTNAKNDEDVDGYAIGSVEHTNIILFGVAVDLGAVQGEDAQNEDVRDDGDSERTITDDISYAPRDELTQQTTSKAIDMAIDDEINGEKGNGAAVSPPFVIVLMGAERGEEQSVN
ncbi:hypothetical protein V2J09_003441 [Rumex salicifolius]